MNNLFDFQDLRVWQEAIRLSKRIYIVTENFPNREKCGLVDQIRRAGNSVSLNIAEGKGRFYTKKFRRFLLNSRGSLYEVVSCLELAKELNLLQEIQYKELLGITLNVQKMISGLIRSLS